MKEQIEVTFEDYLQAKKFSRWKYKYGIFVLIGCWICLGLIAYYIWYYAEQLVQHPVLYAVKKLGVDYCYCYGDQINYYINDTSISSMENLISP